MLATAIAPGQLEAVDAAALAIDPDSAWSAVLRRDRSADGSFVTGVLTTGIYCRPSCAARHPRRERPQPCFMLGRG